MKNLFGRRECIGCAIVSMLGLVLLRIVAWPLAIGTALIVAVWLIVGAKGAEHHSNPWLLSWIPATCCVTNDCCWEISERELTAYPDDYWMVNSTGDVKKRTGWSPDGKFYRCACDLDKDSNKWIRHQGANTRCIFVPQRLF